MQRAEKRATVVGNIWLKMVHQHPACTARMPSKLVGGRKKKGKRDGPLSFLLYTPPPFCHSSPTVSHNAPAQCVKARERGERESHLTLTGMLMWAAMQLHWSIPPHSSTAAQGPRLAALLPPRSGNNWAPRHYIKCMAWSVMDIQPMNAVAHSHMIR